MIAITGFSGFVGTQLLSSLDLNNCLLLGRKAPGRNQKFCEFDLASAQESRLTEALKPVTTLIHLAARVHVMNELVEEPLAEYRAVNSKGTLHLAMQAANSGVKRFIFLSSIKANGETTTNKLPFSITGTPTPEDPYGISKYEAEQQLLKLCEKTSMELVIIRPPLIYGPNVKANFAALINLVNKGLPLPFGMVNSNKRSMVYVGNLVDLIINCIDNPDAANQIFMVSDGNDLSTRELINQIGLALGKNALQLPFPVWAYRLLGKLTGKSETVERLVGSLQVDIKHTKDILNWSPPFSVEQGIAATAQAFLKEKHK